MYEYGHLGRWYIKLTLFKRFQQISQKNKVVTGKTPLFVISWENAGKTQCWENSVGFV